MLPMWVPGVSLLDPIYMYIVFWDTASDKRISNQIFIFVSPLKCMLYVLIRSASVRRLYI